MKRILTLLLFSAPSLMAQAPFYPTSSASGFRFGGAVSADENRFLISSASTPNAAGKVYLFEKNPAITQVATFSQTDGMLTDMFGQSLSISGNMVAIGAEQHNSTGAVYTYRKINGSWNFLQKLIPTNSDMDDRFGVVRLHGDYLFIGSTGAEPTGLPNSADQGSVYVYHFNGNLWSLTQELTIEGTSRLGVQIETQGDRMITSSLTADGGTLFHSFILNAGQWEPETSSAEYGSSEFPIAEFSLSADGLYFIERPAFGSHTVKKLAFGDWTETALVNFSSFDQIYDRVEICADKMFVGSGHYTLQLQRKFPVLFYKNDGQNWDYQTTIYGTGPESSDDYFGISMGHSGDNLIVGAPQESITGRAYFVDLQSLAVQSIPIASVSVYPNPTSGRLYILSDQIVESVRVYSVTGSLCYSADGPLESIDVQNLQTGLYVAHVTLADGQPTTFKFLRN